MQHGEFNTIKVDMGASMTAEVLVNKDFQPKTRPTILFYHGFPDNKFTWLT